MCLSHSTISRNIYHNIYNVDIENYVVLGFSPYDGRIQSRIVSVKWTCQRLRKSSRPWLLQLQDRLPGESFTEPGNECAAKGDPYEHPASTGFAELERDGLQDQWIEENEL